MTKILNPTKTPVGVRVNGALKIIKPGCESDLELDERQAAKLTRMGLVLSETPIDDTDGIRMAYLQSEVAKATQFDAPIDYSSHSDDELRAIVKANGLHVHHKAGRAKLLEALGA